MLWSKVTFAQVWDEIDRREFILDTVLNQFHDKA